MNSASTVGFGGWLKLSRFLNLGYHEKHFEVRVREIADSWAYVYTMYIYIYILYIFK